MCGRLGNALGDYATAQDNAIPADLLHELDWETPATINDTWGFKTHDHNWKSTETLVKYLVDIVSKGGNYLLNIGPDAEGNIPEPSVQRLQEIGKWMDANSESIYGTRPGPIQGVDWCRTTIKDDTIYLHIFDWSDDSTFELAHDLNLKSASWLDSKITDELSVTSSDGKLQIQAPATMPTQPVTVIRLQIEK